MIGLSHTDASDLRASPRHALGLAWGLTLLGMVAEAWGGWWSGSLALWSDAAHMLTDTIALGLGFLAARVSCRPATPGRTFGLLRVEILATLANGVILVPLAGMIVMEAFHRFGNPTPLRAGPMLGVASLGFVINCVCAALLFRAQRTSLNVRGVFFHVIGDTIGSVGTLIAGGLVAGFGWVLADPIASTGIAVLILVGACHLVWEAAEILLEGTPRHIDLPYVENDLRSVGGVKSVHDLHIWTLTSGMYAMSCHAVAEGDRSRQEILTDLAALCRDRYRIEHTTIQIEETSLESSESRIC